MASLVQTAAGCSLEQRLAVSCSPAQCRTSALSMKMETAKLRASWRKRFSSRCASAGTTHRMMRSRRATKGRAGPWLSGKTAIRDGFPIPSSRGFTPACGSLSWLQYAVVPARS